MAGLATGAKQTGVTEAENDFAVRPGRMRDHPCPCRLSRELVDTVTKLWRQPNKGRFDHVDVGTASASADSSAHDTLWHLYPMQPLSISLRKRRSVSETIVLHEVLRSSS